MASDKEILFKISGALLAILGFAMLVQPQSFNLQSSPTTLFLGIIGMAAGAFIFIKSEK